MTYSLITSINEAASSILSNVETMSNEEIDDILSHDELQEMDTALWEMVEMTQ